MRVKSLANSLSLDHSLTAPSSSTRALQREQTRGLRHALSLSSSLVAAPIRFDAPKCCGPKLGRSYRHKQASERASADLASNGITAERTTDDHDHGHDDEAAAAVSSVTDLTGHHATVWPRCHWKIPISHSSTRSRTERKNRKIKNQTCHTCKTEQARLRTHLNNKELEIAALRTENIAQNATIKTLQQSEVESKRRIKKYKDRYREKQRLNNILVQSNHQIRI